jgi:hypothetical protein
MPENRARILRDEMLHDPKRFANTVMQSRWEAQPNDIIGAWCVTVRGAGPPSRGVPEIADFMHQEVAEHIAELHNASLLDGEP